MLAVAWPCELECGGCRWAGGLGLASSRFDHDQGWLHSLCVARGEHYDFTFKVVAS